MAGLKAELAGLPLPFSEADRRKNPLTSTRTSNLICVLGGNDRIGSMFITGMLEYYGSHYTFLYGNEALNNGCEEGHTLTLISKNELNEAIHGMLQHELPRMALVSGDESCGAERIPEYVSVPRYVGRQYDSAQYANETYYPLGPRSELTFLGGNVTGAPRRYMANFVGSLSTTRSDRQRLQGVLERWSPRPKDAGVFHFAEKWVGHADEDQDHLGPIVYQKVLLASYYTLCPMGHAVETFRFWEAVDALSIPILIEQTDANKNTGPGRCSHTFQHVLRSRPPIIVLPNWDSLPAYLEKQLADPEFERNVQRQQLALAQWSDRWWRRVAIDVDEAIDKRVPETEGAYEAAALLTHAASDHASPKRIYTRVQMVKQASKQAMGPLLRSAGFDAEYLPHVHDPSHAFRGVRHGRKDAFTFQQVSDLVESEGHQWCSLYRDNWSCVGERYREMLRSTPPYNESLTFAAFPPNTTIYAEGNSWLAEIILTIMCNTKAVFWNVGAHFSVSGLMEGSAVASYILHLPLRNRLECGQIGTYSTVAGLNHSIIPDTVHFPGGGDGLTMNGKKPIVHFGSTTVQGGAVARSGNLFTSIYGRSLGRAVLNFGFVEQGTVDPAVAEYLGQARCAFSDKNLHSRMPLVPTPVCLKRAGV
jgi:hypothetical protein